MAQCKILPKPINDRDVLCTLRQECGRLLPLLWPLCVCVCVCVWFSSVQLFVTPWTVAHQAPLSMLSSRQEYWSGFPFPSPGDLPNQGIESTSLASPALVGGLFNTGPPEKPNSHLYHLPLWYPLWSLFSFHMLPFLSTGIWSQEQGTESEVVPQVCLIICSIISREYTNH